jgi:hypothetical protein
MVRFRGILALNRLVKGAMVIDDLRDMSQAGILRRLQKKALSAARDTADEIYGFASLMASSPPERTSFGQYHARDA